jgi:small subunit ribosomal protein S4
MVKKPYPPGMKGKRRKASLSEYGKELREKQKLKNWYNLRERQFEKYVKEILRKRSRVEDAGSILIKKLEMRLDNVVFRLGFASSRVQARQLIQHGHFLVNKKIVRIPSYEVKKGDTISIKPISAKKTAFKNLSTLFKKYEPPSWISLNKENLEGKIVDLPKLEEVVPPAEISSIFEYYSR